MSLSQLQSKQGSRRTWTAAAATPKLPNCKQGRPPSSTSPPPPPGQTTSKARNSVEKPQPFEPFEPFHPASSEDMIGQGTPHQKAIIQLLLFEALTELTAIKSDFRGIA